MIGLPWDSAARTSRRQFCAEGAAGEGEGSRPHSNYMNEHLALEVASREEDEDHLRAADVALQSADVFEIIDVEKHLDARQKQLQLALDDRDGVLTGGPIERGGGSVRNATLLPQRSES